MTVRDLELLDLLRGEPQLLAIADAVATTQKRKARLSRRLFAVPAIAAALIAVALFAPWQSSTPSLFDRALAAVGNEPVLHVVTQRTEPADWQLVDLATGERTESALSIRTEIWYDGERGLKHSIARVNGTVSDDLLETPQGVTSQGGPVYTCAWIQAHPVQATRARVSCRLDGKNGTVPRDVPEPAPIIDPGLEGFLDGYQESLANGTAQKVGEGTVRGRPVFWLQMRLAQPRPPGADRTPDPIEQRVAIDSESYRPLRIRSLQGGGAYDVVEIRSVSREAADFSEPTPLKARQQVSSGSVVSSTEIGLDAARSVLGRPGLWAGPRIAGLELEAVNHVLLRTGYARSTGLDPRETDGLTLQYGSGSNTLELEETTEPSFAYGWARGSQYPVPPEGSVRIGPFDWGWLVRDGVYVRITGTLGEGAVLAAARALEEIPASVRRS
jgi:hypothetical protein